MPTNPNGAADEAQGAGEELFTLEQVEQLVTENDRKWQGRLTPLHQQRAEDRRIIGQLEGRLQALENNGGARGNHGDQDGHDAPVSFTGIDSEEALGERVNKAIAHRLREYERKQQQSTERPQAPSPTEERLEDFLLAQDMRELQGKYRGMTEYEMGQVVELGRRLGNGDLNYLAFTLYGSPDEWKAGRRSNAQDDDEDDQPRRRAPAMLRGRARAQANARAAATQGREIEVSGGVKGYRQVDDIAEKWLRDRGHS